MGCVTIQDIDDIEKQSKRLGYLSAICDVVNLLKERGLFIDEIYDLYDDYKILLKKDEKVLTLVDTSV